MSIAARRTPRDGGACDALDSCDVFWITAIVCVAAGMRALFYTGYFGSDEVTYTEAALDVLRGTWTVSDYIGSIRYGINIPVAGFMALFGVNETAANLWSFTTSLGEVALVYWAGRVVWGRRAGVLAALVIAFVPLHVHFAGRLMGDAPLAFFMTLSCVLFLKAESSRSTVWFVAAGFAAGAVFWIKQPVVVYVAIFGAYALLRRRWHPGLLWMALGFTLVVAANLALMRWITGDALHVFKVARTGVERFVQSGAEETSPLYYPHYLLGDIRHTWMLGFLAIGGGICLLRERQRNGALADEAAFVAIWAVCVILVFSLFVVSFSPLTLVFKQTNYMLMFVAPLALLAGLALARLSGAILVPALGVTLAGSFLLAALEQQAIQVFTSNSKAAAAFAESANAEVVYATTNNVRAGIFANMMAGRGARPGPLKELRELTEPLTAAPAIAEGAVGAPAFAIVDLETIGWSNRGSPIGKVADVPQCWPPQTVLEPKGLGFGHRVVEAMIGAAKALPGPLASRMLPRLEALTAPQPAYVFRVEPRCNDELRRAQPSSGRLQADNPRDLAADSPWSLSCSTAISADDQRSGRQIGDQIPDTRYKGPLHD